MKKESGTKSKKQGTKPGISLAELKKRAKEFEVRQDDAITTVGVLAHSCNIYKK